MQEVIVYTTTTCPFCKLAKSFLSEHNIAFTEKDVTSDQAVQQEMIGKSGQMAVPVITVGEEVLVGYNENKLRELLHIS